ncbi:unnamed protein product [Amoebophrya sp. A120]|nr:unnamed protein product [Amoebophrya sp. A120]|eukprot:GSA120T00008732001.1
MPPKSAASPRPPTGWEKKDLDGVFGIFRPKPKGKGKTWNKNERRVFLNAGKEELYIYYAYPIQRVAETISLSDFQSFSTSERPDWCYIWLYFTREDKNVRLFTKDPSAVEAWTHVLPYFFQTSHMQALLQVQGTLVRENLYEDNILPCQYPLTISEFERELQRIASFPEHQEQDKSRSTFPSAFYLQLVAARRQADILVSQGLK